MNRRLTASLFVLGLAVLAAVPLLRRPARAEEPTRPLAVARGEYLVKSMGCNDCHTPWTTGPNGPQPDGSRRLSGHPESLAITEAPALPKAPWNAMVTHTNTAWAGPWGVSFTANLTPDVETGLGGWTEREFRDAIRNGRHRGHGRAILPPMPAQMIANLTDEDLSAVFAYLRSLEPIHNRVPEPLPPAATPAE